MRILRTCLFSSLLAFFLLSCGIDKPDMSSGYAEQDLPDRGSPADDPGDVSDGASPSSDNENSDVLHPNDDDFTEKEYENDHQDGGHSDDEDFYPSSDEDELPDLDAADAPDISDSEDFDLHADDDHDEAADLDESDDSVPSAVSEDPEGPQFVNSDMQAWIEDSLVGWKKSEGALPTLKLEKEISDAGNFALRVIQPQNSKNKPAFESEWIETAEESPLPERIEFELKTGNLSKIAAELVCGESSLKYKYMDETKTFIRSGNYTYNQIELPAWTSLSIKFGEEITDDFWRNQQCKLLFRTGSGLDFDVSFDNFKIIY